MRRHVTGTYRLQLHADFTFADAARRVGYFADLGVSHLYLSPILQAAPGSMHGYDVVDHSRISNDLGGLTGFEELAAAAHSRDLGLIVDVVPNHMAFVAPENLNRQVWQVLKDGRDAETAHWFDIDWKAGGGRIGIPVLGDTLDAVLEAGEITLDTLDGEPVLRYFDHVWPVNLGTENSTDISEIVQRQHYRLTSWRDKDDALNYRRFFEVDELIAVRVELPDVFDETHRLLLELHHRDLIDGFRIDHPDGLADPTAYLERLADRCERGTPIWVEKILEPGEQLPRSWKAAGTTGYDALRVIQLSLVDPTATPTLVQAWEECGGDASYDRVVDQAKRQVVAKSLGPEVDRLTRRAREALPDLDPERLRDAVVELLVAGEVYRAYVRPDHRLSTIARKRLTDAFSGAVHARPDLRDELEALIPLTVLAEDDAAATDFAIRLQQTWGPVMAKGIEDTTFYRWHEFIALNEVGSDPSAVGAASPLELHEWAAEQTEHWPRTMTTLSTHDTKRSEDVRARLLAIGGDPLSWQSISSATYAAAQGAGVDGPTAHLVWQTLVGVGDISAERLTSYLQKALREAKLHTAWVDGDQEYEQRVIDFALAAAARGPVRNAIDAALARNARAVRATVLGAKLLQLTAPGVPDTYQGCEAVNLSLVDPDNRRPVDFDHLSSALAADSTDPVADLSAAKLHVTTTALRLRRAQPNAFGPESSYRSIPSSSEHLLGFERSVQPGRIAGALGRGNRATIAALATRAPSRLSRDGGWANATLELEQGQWHDHISGTTHTSDGHLLVADVLGAWPVALLERSS